MVLQTEQPKTVKAPCYDEDVYLWSIRTAELIRSAGSRKWIARTWPSRSRAWERDIRLLRSRTRVLLAHMLKQHYQSEERSRSWNDTIEEQRDSIESIIVDSPSLKRMLAELIGGEYERAVQEGDARGRPNADAFPKVCPYDPIQVYGKWMLG